MANDCWGVCTRLRSRTRAHPQSADVSGIDHIVAQITHLDASGLSALSQHLLKHVHNDLQVLYMAAQVAANQSEQGQRDQLLSLFVDQLEAESKEYLLAILIKRQPQVRSRTHTHAHAHTRTHTHTHAHSSRSSCSLPC